MAFAKLIPARPTDWRFWSMITDLRFLIACIPKPCSDPARKRWFDHLVIESTKLVMEETGNDKDESFNIVWSYIEGIPFN